MKFVKRLIVSIILILSLIGNTVVFADINPNAQYGFDTYDTPEQQVTTDTYVLNTKSHKIHYPSCRSAKKIKPENYSTTSVDINTLSAQGYTKCGQCFH